MNTQTDTNRVVSDESAADHTQARIKLAEAMGWKYWDMPFGKESTRRVWQQPNEPIQGAWTQSLPDPFTDANDDVAVLKWARENLTPRQFVKFSENIANLLIGLEKKKPFDALCISLTTEYQIGFYAKAVLPQIVEDSGT